MNARSVHARWECVRWERVRWVYAYGVGDCAASLCGQRWRAPTVWLFPNFSFMESRRDSCPAMEHPSYEADRSG